MIDPDELKRILEGVTYEWTETEKPGVYCHTFTPPGFTFADLAKLLARLPDAPFPEQQQGGQ